MAKFITNLFTDFNTAAPIYAGVEKQALSTKLPAEAETVIIGAGLTGLSTAIELAEAGHNVVVLDAKKIASGPSGRSGGQLWPGYEGTLGEMKETFGDALAITAWEMTHAALRTVHERIATRDDKCDFRPGVLLTSKTEPQAEWIKTEAQVFADSGFGFASYLSAQEIKDNFVNTDMYLNGLLYKGEEGQQYGHLNPKKYTQTLARMAEEKGAKLIEDSPTQEVSTLSDGSYLVTTPRGDIKAKNIVLATGSDFLRAKGLDYAIVPRTYVPVQTIILATEPIPEELARKMVPGDACFCDAADAAMNYGRLIPEDGRKGWYRLAFGGADALAQVQTAIEASKIEKEMRALFPDLDTHNIKVEAIWGGKCDLSRSALPVLANPLDGLYMASGFSGQGMVNTALYGSAIADRILGKSSEKFDVLQKLNSDPYANNALVAWVQAAATLAPVVLETYLEERAEKPLRKARATQTPTLKS